MQTYYLIRHCEASGQAPDAPLTARGHEQAAALAEFFTSIPVDRILSSPFRRAQDTIFPLATARDCPVEPEARLQERVLSTASLSDWQTALQETFTNLNVRFPGGETSRETITRMMSVLEDTSLHSARHTIFVTHGNAMALLLHSIDPGFGYSGWQQLQNPDIYRLIRTSEGLIYERLLLP